MQLVYSVPGPVRAVGLSSVTVEMGYDSALALWESTSHRSEDKTDRRKGVWHSHDCIITHCCKTLVAYRSQNLSKL